MNNMSAAGGCRPQRRHYSDYFFFLAAFFAGFFFVATDVTSFRGHVSSMGLSPTTQTVVAHLTSFSLPPSWLSSSSPARSSPPFVVIV